MKRNEKINIGKKSTMSSTSSSSTSEFSNIKEYISSESSLESHLPNEMLRSSKIRYGRNSLIEAEIDKFPFEFPTNEMNVDQERSYVKSDDESYIIDDIFKYQQLPDMSDFWEGLYPFSYY
ncbi:uncharacterized protein ACRADG_011217 isoform 2-T3 [Cochliomyia hominivorax]